MAAEEEQEFLLSFRVLKTLPTPSFSSRGWKFVSQEGVSRPGIEIFMLMKPFSGSSINITTAFWGTGTPYKATFFFPTSTVEARVKYWGDSPWGFLEEIWRLYAALKIGRAHV